MVRLREHFFGDFIAFPAHRRAYPCVDFSGAGIAEGRCRVGQDSIQQAAPAGVCGCGYGAVRTRPGKDHRQAVGDHDGQRGGTVRAYQGICHGHFPCLRQAVNQGNVRGMDLFHKPQGAGLHAHPLLKDGPSQADFSGIIPNMQREVARRCVSESYAEPRRTLPFPPKHTIEQPRAGAGLT